MSKEKFLEKVRNGLRRVRINEFGEGSQGIMGNKLEVTNQTISNAERGQYEPKIGFLYDWADTCGYEPRISFKKKKKP